MVVHKNGVPDKHVLLRGLVLLAILGFISLPASADEDPHATGLRPPSVEQQAWDRAHMVVPQRIRLNPLGLTRVNARRSEKGLGRLAPAAADISSFGDEVVGTPEDHLRLDGLATESVSAAGSLPAAVDNSALKYFPPIRSQGSIGSCAQWAGMYYCFTHMNALARDWDAKNGGDAYRFSPKFTYNMVNGGSDAGSWPTEGWFIATKHGAATWADWPYDGSFRGWPLTAAVWRNALNVRVQSTGYVYGCNTPTGMEQLKTLLVNGYVLSFGTYINSWQFKTIPNDPATDQDDAFVGQSAGYWVNGTNGSHAMTVVGYNDHIWVDINGNGIVNPGEKGAFRIANSWGTSWKDAGFTWLSYDALQYVSGVAGGPSSGRQQAWWGSYAMWVTAKAAYNPIALAQFTLNQAHRNELRVSLGMSDTTQTEPTTTWTPNSVLWNAGGPYAFNGGTTAMDAVFVMDFSDIASTYDTGKRWYVRVQDTTAGSSTTLKAFKWINGVDNAEVAHASLPATLDNTTAQYYVDATMTHGAGNTVPTIASISNQVVNEDTATGSISFTVGDAQTAANALTVSGASSNSTLLPNSAIVFGGSGANRTVTMTPAVNQTGSTVITLTVTDAGGLIAQTTFSLTVTPVNDTPVAQGQSLGVLLNTAKTILLSGSDADGDSLTFAPAAPSHGELTGTPPNVVYTPDTGFVGVDTFTFTASDGILTSPPASVILRTDTLAPTVAIIHPVNGETISKTYQMMATASDNVSVSRLVFYIDAVARSTYSAGAGLYMFNWNTWDDANGAHTLTARAYDNAGNSALSTAVNVTVNNAASAQLVVDPPSLNFYGVVGGTRPPVSPLSISKSGAENMPSWSISVNADWLSVSPLLGNTEEVVSVGIAASDLSAGVYIGTVTVTPVGGASVRVPVTYTLTPATDDTPPSVPTGLAGAVTGPTTILLSWSASTDTGGSGLAGYRLYRDGADIAHPPLPHFTDSGLITGTTYGYRVLAVDNAGNPSALSSLVQVTATPEGPPSGLQEAYSFPEPATHGAPPVIRAVLGEVDHMEITIYDMKGTPVHSDRMEAPNAIAEGKAAYDYTWEGDIPSGAYYAVIHGKAGSETVKAKTRFTVVR